MLQLRLTLQHHRVHIGQHRQRLVEVEDSKRSAVVQGCTIAELGPGEAVVEVAEEGREALLRLHEVGIFID